MIRRRDLSRIEGFIPNCVLLFVVLFFVYPLKVVANNLVPRVTGIGESGFAKLSEC